MSADSDGAIPAPAPRAATPQRPGARDLTTGPINRTLLLFALPTLGSSILQSLNGSINSVWVGRFLGAQALAATSNANMVMFLMFAAVFGFGMAATILIGQAMGRRDVDGARRVVGGAVGLFLLMSVVTAALGWVLTPALLRLLATPGPAFPLALAYLRVIFLAMPAMFLSTLLVMSLRGTGDSLTPLLFMGFATLADVGLNPVFILGLGPAPRLGIAGAATATLIANLIACVGLVAYIQGRGLAIRLRGAEWRYLWPDARLVALIVGKGVPMGLQMIVLSVSMLAVVGLVNRYGIENTAAFGVASQLWTYIQMPAMALGAAVSAMAAQNIGAGRWDRVDRIARAGVGMNVVITAAMIVAVTLVDRQVLGLFLPHDAVALEIARHIQWVVSWSFVLFGVSIVLTGVVRANGAVIAPLVILAVAALPVRLGVSYVLAPIWGTDGIWWGFPVGSVVSLVLTWGYYRHGGWRAMRMAAPGPIEAEEQTMAGPEAGNRLQPSG